MNAGLGHRGLQGEAEDEGMLFITLHFQQVQALMLVLRISQKLHSLLNVLSCLLFSSSTFKGSLVGSLLAAALV